MPRKPRIVVPDYPHHVIQRGNRRQCVFFGDEDLKFYLDLLKKQGDRAGLSFWAYCLMGNHIHMIIVPKTPQSLAQRMNAIHWRYSLAINLRKDWKGSLWQGRFQSYLMDQPYLMAAVRYIELNPVRAGLVARAEDYPWSSAKAHVHKAPDPIIVDCCLLDEIKDWAGFLDERPSEAEVRMFKEHASTGRPLGDQGFIEKLEKMTGRKIALQKPGRKPITPRPG